MWDLSPLKPPAKKNNTLTSSNSLQIASCSTYSATTVFPADVCAETKTDWLFSKQLRASF